MMPPTNPKPGDIAIFVRAENVPEKCTAEFCLGCHPDAVLSEAIVRAGGTPYNVCGGSGTRTITLEGWVEVIGWSSPNPAYDDRLADEDYLIECKGFFGASERRKWAQRDLCIKITQALHDNTCPDEIRAQLSEVDS